MYTYRLCCANTYARTHTHGAIHKTYDMPFSRNWSQQHERKVQKCSIRCLIGMSETVVEIQFTRVYLFCSMHRIFQCTILWSHTSRSLCHKYWASVSRFIFVFLRKILTASSTLFFSFRSLFLSLQHEYMPSHFDSDTWCDCDVYSAVVFSLSVSSTEKNDNCIDTHK